MQNKVRIKIKIGIKIGMKRIKNKIRIYIFKIVVEKIEKMCKIYEKIMKLMEVMKGHLIKVSTLMKQHHFL